MKELIELVNSYRKSASIQDITLVATSNDENFIVTFTYKNNTYPINFKINKNFKIESLGDYDTNHLVNLINKKKYESIDNIVDIVPDCLDYIIDLYKYCISCQEQLEVPSNEFSTCGKDECIFKMEELPIGEYILNLYQKYPDKVELILITSYETIRSQRREKIFEPFPTHFLIDKNKNKPERGKMTAFNANKKCQNNKNWVFLDKVVNQFTTDQIVAIISKSVTEQDIKSKLGDDTYILVRFLLMSNRCNINIVNLIGHKDLKSFQVIHPFDKEDEFKKKSQSKSVLLYHGSKFDNWYSIMRNGIKVCSNTELMTAGAAHGKGIYTSDNFSTSLGYCGYNYNSKIIMGVFEVVGTKSDYKPGGSIFVIPSDDILILRYILCFPHNLSSIISQKLNDKFSIKIHQENSLINNRIKTKGMKRLTKDLSDLQNNSCEFMVSYDPDNIQKWSIMVTDFDKDSQLVIDMKNFDIPFVEIEILFEDNYPYSPPFVRIIYPRFKYQTGHITSKGALCMEILTPNRWSPAYSIESLLIQIKSTITEGGAKIDPQNYSTRYTLTEAKQSFVLVAKQHGWM
jgi:ubiquitin-protein ligase